jgi:photosystem II stability/assembly factor-like uncharacterized protein
MTENGEIRTIRKNTMTVKIPSLCLFSLFIAFEACAARDHGSWRKTLHEKAMNFERDTSERHNILGTYPSIVRIVPPTHYVDPSLGGWRTFVDTGELPPGWTIDHGTTGSSNIAHSSSWTGCLLTAEAFRVAFLRDSVGTDHPDYKLAHARASEVIGGLRILTLVSGQPGYLARGIARGHGISYEERAGVGTRDLWKQGAGKYSHLRYRGGPSHHNYDHVFRGLGIYHFVAADDAQKGAIRDIVRDMSNWAHLENDMRVMHDDGVRESTVLIGGWRGTEGTTEPSGGSLMATTGLKIAYTITGNKKVETLYNKWVDRLGYRDPERTGKSIMGPPRGNYDDTDHLLGDLYLLNLIEKDPDLLRFYRKCVRDSWQLHKDEKMAWFNFIYRAVLGDGHGDPDGSLWNLQTFPTCRLFKPQMNSIRTDIEFVTRDGRKEALHPLPVYERRSDNEYEWKGSPFGLDGWHSRIVSVVEVSPIDPYVQFAADTSGNAYVSLSKGELWHGMKGLPQVNDFQFSPDYAGIAFAATSDGIYRTLDGGRTWAKVFDRPVLRLKLNHHNTNILYAVGTHGIYRSTDLGEQQMGTVWRDISAPAPSEDACFAVDLSGNSPALYMLTPDGIYTRGADQPEWQAPQRQTRSRGFGTFDPVGGKPLWLRVDDTTLGRLFRAVSGRSRRGTSTLISVSDDGGATWSPVLRKLDPLVKWGTGVGETTDLTYDEMRKLRAYAAEFSMDDLRVDAHNPNRWYGRMESGVAITEDAGRTWRKSSQGLDIPRVNALWTSRSSDEVYVGTPAGLYVSRDGGQTWQDTTLILQCEGAERQEISGIGYLAAYWMARYHNFIDDRTAHAEWWK